MGLSEREATGALALLGRIGITLSGMENGLAELQTDRDAWRQRAERAEERLAELEAKATGGGKAEKRAPGPTGTVLTDGASVGAK